MKQFSWLVTMVSKVSVMNIKVMALVTCIAGAVLAQERPLEPMVQGDLAPGGSQTYTFRANAGDVISGTFELKGPEAVFPVTLTVFDESGSAVKDDGFWSSSLPVGFLTPKAEGYRIRITANSAAGGSYTLRTKRQTPTEWIAGAAAVTPVVTFKSARIAELIKDVSSGQAGAVERFWSEAEARGTPLLETIDGADQYVLATFLWKEIYETHNVLVALAGPGAPTDGKGLWSGNAYMSHVPGTNIWYKTERLFRGSRLSYQLAPNHRGDDYLTAQKDPLNPRIKNGGSSVLETPSAPDESWYRRIPSVRGTITHHRLDSVLLKGPRDVSVYTPPGYAPANGPYRLLVLFDGEAYAALPPSTGYDNVRLGAPNTLDNLIAADRIQPAVVCFISDNRKYIMNVTNASSDQKQTYAAAMATELVPWLRSSYAISKDAKDVVIGGYSAGANAAIDVAMHYSDVFGNVLVQSGGFNSLPSLAIALPKVPVRFYIDNGSYEGWSWRSLPSEEQARTQIPAGEWPYILYVLLAKGYDVTYRETAGAHEGVHWAATLAEGLMALLGQPVK